MAVVGQDGSIVPSRPELEPKWPSCRLRSRPLGISRPFSTTLTNKGFVGTLWKTSWAAPPVRPVAPHSFRSLSPGPACYPLIMWHARKQSAPQARDKHP